MHAYLKLMPPLDEWFSNFYKFSEKEFKDFKRGLFF